ncbi:MAG TPA: DNA translocase FtsK, partial [Rhizobiales bacterium]|nr:DNA translocase FtsK [Hyphomicrobiales bacterium]
MSMANWSARNAVDDLVPEWLSAFVRRRALELAGTGLFGLALASGVSILSWTSSDPSLNQATSAPVKNLLGYPGAIMADSLLQMFGVTALVLLVIVALWGWRMASHHGIDHFFRRFSVLVVGLGLLSGVLALLPAPGIWPLTSGLGGAIGEIVLDHLGVFSKSLIPETTFWPVALLVMLALALPLLLHASTLSFMQIRGAARVFGEEGREGATHLLGAATHMFFASRSAYGRSRTRLTRFLGWLPFMRRKDDAEDIDDWEDDDEDWEDSPSFLQKLAGLLKPSHWFKKSEPAISPRRPGARIEPVFSRSPVDLDDLTFADEPVKTPEQDLKSAARRVERSKKKIRPGKRARTETEPEFAFHQSESYEFPSIEFLSRPPANATKVRLSDQALEQNARLLEGVLEDFGIRGEIFKVRPGPVVTLYELRPAPGIKSSRVIGLADDIARSMSAISARIAVIPGQNAIGIELPNATRETVFMHELVASTDYENSKAALPLILGKTIGGEPLIADLSRMPHLLIAGTTGAGKSVGINTMILSLLYRMSPENCKLIMIDPKMLELSVYDGIPHLLTPVVTDPGKAVVALKWTVREMETRYQNMSKLGVRNIDGYNARVKQAAARGEVLTRKVQTGFDPETGQPIYEVEDLDLSPMPYIVVIIDEMADLMMVAGKDIEGAVQRLAQMARAAGIHMITATQRPSVDVITGTIKANFPTRISFQVTSKIDSRTILGE